jgi:hypothetical protein
MNKIDNILESGIDVKSYTQREFLELFHQYKDYLEKFQGIGRNDLCGCGSGKKYKKCCLKTHSIGLFDKFKNFKMYRLDPKKLTDENMIDYFNLNAHGEKSLNDFGQEIIKYTILF